MNECGNAAQAPSQNRCGGSESTHAEHDLWFELLVNGAATRKTFGEPPNESEDGRGANRGKPDSWQFFETKLRTPGKSEAIDLFFGNEQEHFVPAFAQNFGDCNAREEMPTRASACNNRVHFRDCRSFAVKFAASYALGARCLFC